MRGFCFVDKLFRLVLREGYKIGHDSAETQLHAVLMVCGALDSGSGADDGHCSFTSSSFKRINSCPPSSDDPAPTDLRRISSEADLLQYQHFDVSSRTWARGIPTAGSASPGVQKIHREMLDEFVQAVEAELVVQVAAVSPGCRRYPKSPKPRDEPAKKRLSLVRKKKTARRGHASRDGSPVAAAETAQQAASAGPAAPGTVPRWLRRLQRISIKRLVKNDGALLFVDAALVISLLLFIGCLWFVLICASVILRKL